MQNIGDKLKSRRVEVGLTLEAVGNMVGVSKSTVRKWENGIISEIGSSKIVLLAKALQVSPLYILGLEDKTEPVKPNIPQNLINLFKDYNQLNNIGQQEASKRIEELTQIKRYKKDKYSSDNNSNLTNRFSVDKDLKDDEDDIIYMLRKDDEPHTNIGNSNDTSYENDYEITKIVEQFRKEID